MAMLFPDHNDRDYGVLIGLESPDPAFVATVQSADAATLCNALDYAYDNVLSDPRTCKPIEKQLEERFGFVSADIEALSLGVEPESPAARAALGLSSVVAPVPDISAAGDDYEKRRRDILRCCPASDQSLKSACETAPHGELTEALDLRGRAGQKTAFGIIRAELIRRNAYSRNTDPVPRFEDYPALTRGQSADVRLDEVAHFPPAQLPMSATTDSIPALRDPKSLALHPCLDGMPELATDDAKFQALVADVRDRGFDYPAIIDEQDRVIDGRHRRRIAILLGLELPTVRRAGAEASEIILSTLLQRRHYSKGALAYMAAPLFAQVVEDSRARRLANLQAGVDSRKPTQSVIGKTVEQLSEELGFSLDLYTQAKKVRELFADETEHEWPDLERPTTVRRYFEPRLLSAEIGLGGVIQACAGKFSTEGKAKLTPPVATLFERGLQSFTKRFELRWEKLTPADRQPIVRSVASEAAKWPEDVRQAVLSSLTAVAKHKPSDTAY